MTPRIPQQVPTLYVGSTRLGKIDMQGMLDEGETLATAGIDNADGLTIDQVAVSEAPLTINGISVPAGMAIQFRATGFTADTQYKPVFGFTTSAGQTDLQPVKMIGVDP